jgi:hypothetical protein
MKNFLIGTGFVIYFAMAGFGVYSLVSDASASGGLTADMIRVALASAHVDTRPGSQLKLLDRTTGQWHLFVLDRFTTQAYGHHATINIDVHEVQQ